jgi:hypothetical protein
MTPKEKAEELVLKYLRLKRHKMFNGWWHKMISKQCALIAVEFSKEFITGDLSEAFDKFLYIQDIKQEIEKL